MSTFALDRAFGQHNENTTTNTLETFLETKLNHRGGYSIFDYDNGANIFVELKTRRIPHNQYPTAIIGGNKVLSASNHPENTYWFMYKYMDGLYGIKYSKDKFDSYTQTEYSRGDREDYHNTPQQCYFIPHTDLQKIL